MRVLLFSKEVRAWDLDELLGLAEQCPLEGYDLCVREGYYFNPDNAATELPKAAAAFRRNGLELGMVTGNIDLLNPADPTAEPLLDAMDRANVRLLKLGYFRFDPTKQDYWPAVDRAREALDGWQKLSMRHNVKICYHTHSGRYLGLNCGMLAHLLRGCDPACIGAYLDPGHMNIAGEEFAVGLAVMKRYLSMVALKDSLLERAEKNGHGSVKSKFVEAGKGMVDWTAVFYALARAGFDGPVSVHCEHEMPRDERFPAALAKEVAYFRAHRDRVAKAV